MVLSLGRLVAARSDTISSTKSGNDVVVVVVVVVVDVVVVVVAVALAELLDVDDDDEAARLPLARTLLTRREVGTRRSSGKNKN